MTQIYPSRTIRMLFVMVFAFVSSPALAWWAGTANTLDDSMMAILSRGFDDANCQLWKFESPTSPVKYINENASKPQTPIAHGQYYEATVPDTLDIAERGRLFVENYLTQITVADRMHEPFNRGYFDSYPPRLGLDCGSYLCALGKFRETLPLLRIMTGSRKGLEIDQAWSENLAKCIGTDGLYYVPLVGRPYEAISAYPWVGQAITGGAEFYTNLFIGNGRQLGAMAINYKMTGDETWNKAAQKIVDRLNELAVKSDGMALYPRYYVAPNAVFTDAEKSAALSLLHESKESLEKKDEEFRRTQGEVETNAALWQTWMITGLANYYKVSHYEPALHLATEMAKYMKKVEYIEKWSSHFHCITLGIQAMLELSEASGDRSLAEYASKAYDVAKSGKNMIALPQIGFFVNGNSDQYMEGCSIGDMTAIAVKLAWLGMGDQYWEDVDRYTRNSLAAIQRTSSQEYRIIFERWGKSNSPPISPVQWHELADRLPERLTGTFSSASFPNEHFASTYFDTCCQGNCSRALYYVWENILNYYKDKEELRINLLLNRASPWADIDSYIPYTGRVDIRTKRSLKTLRVRLNDWVQKDKVTCTVDGRPGKFVIEGNVVVLDTLRTDQTVRLDFPIVERVEKLASFGHKYIATFRGNDCIDMNPKGQYWPLYQRDQYRVSKPLFKRVERFVAENAIRY